MMVPSEDSSLLFIIGAGTSRAFGVPDIRTFYDEFKEEQKRRNEDTTLIEKLEQHRKGEVDLETLITDLRNLQAATETMAGVISIPEDLKACAKEANIIHNRLMKFIIKKCEKFDEQRAVRAYRPLLELSHLKPLWIFTTNYDRIIEYSCEMSNIPYSDGFVEQEQGLFLWKDAFDAQLRLAKVHGSINWFRDESSPKTIIKLEEPHPFPTSDFKISFKQYNFSTSIIIPTFEKYISELPFFALQTRLIDAVRRARICFVIGTRLQDPHLRNILLTSVDNTVIVGVGPSPEIIRAKLDNHPNVLTIKSGFEEFALASTGYLSEIIGKLASVDARELAAVYVEKISETLANLGQFLPSEGGSIEELVTGLSSSSYVDRANSARRLGESGIKRAIPSLLKLLDDQSDYVRTQAVSALGLLQAHEALSKFRHLLLNDENEDVKVEVVLALREMGSAGKEILREALNMPGISTYLRSIMNAR